MVTHGGYGLGDSLSVLARRTPQARLADAFSMPAPQERQTITLVMDWIGKIPR
ncbi:hypothetical protein [Sinorhizobium meliloti]|uniref:hypothetical protein n=1 Tax=Rhizobium meliloti TaxID=382 RepID=UPI001F197F1B|nr:hypothetical protein [Sinorhizobium meliloti]